MYSCLLIIEKLLIKGVDMSFRLAASRILLLGIFTSLTGACFHPPFNNFQHDPRTVRKVIGGAVAGSVIGAVAGGTATGALIGAGVGGTVGGISGLYKESKNKIIKDLKKQDIEFIQYGDTMTLIVPTDKYFIFNSPRLNEVCYPGLNNIIRLLRFYPKRMIYVAAFTDNVGSRFHKRMMSQAQAETMMTFLWANNIPAQRLKAEGYGDKNPVSDNALIHGSAQNRRIEIQWVAKLPMARPAMMDMK